MIKFVHADLEQLLTHVVERGSVSIVIVFFASLVFLVAISSGSSMDNTGGAVMMLIGLFFLALGIRDLIVIPVRLRRVSNLLEEVEPVPMFFKKVALHKIKGMDFPWETYLLVLGVGDAAEDGVEQLEVLATRPVLRPTVFRSSTDEFNIPSSVNVYVDPLSKKPFAVASHGAYLFSRSLFAFW